MKHSDLQTSLVFSLLEDVDLFHRKGSRQFPSSQKELQQWIQDGSHPLLLPSRLLLQWTQSAIEIDKKLIVKIEKSWDVELQLPAASSLFRDDSGSFGLRE